MNPNFKRTFLILSSLFFKDYRAPPNMFKYPNHPDAVIPKIPK